MAVIQGTFNSFVDTANNAIDIANTLDMLDTTDVPLLSRVGRDSLRKQCIALKHEWLQGAMRGLDVSLAASAAGFNNTTDPVNVTLATGEAKKVAVNDILLADTELVRITAVNLTTDVISVARAFGGSTAASHADGSTVSIVGQAWLTDADPGTGRYTTVTNVYNYVQAYNSSIKVTSTEQSIEKYVRQNTMDAQLRDEMKVMWQTWERALLHGRKVQPTATVAGAMDGILVNIGNSYAKAGAALTEQFLIDAQKDIYDAGGPQSLTGFVGSTQRQFVSRLLDPYRQTSRTDTTAGTRVTTFESDFGSIDFVLDRNIPKDTIVLVDLSRIGFGPFRDHAMKMVPIATTSGFYKQAQVFGQYTSELHDPQAHAKITGLATA